MLVPKQLVFSEEKEKGDGRRVSVRGGLGRAMFDVNKVTKNIVRVLSPSS